MKQRDISTKTLLHLELDHLSLKEEEKWSLVTLIKAIPWCFPGLQNVQWGTITGHGKLKTFVNFCLQVLQKFENNNTRITVLGEEISDYVGDIWIPYLSLLVPSEFKMLASFYGTLLSVFAHGAFHSKNHLFCRLRLNG